mmetsp:Transcript_11511/g.26560  ORF Transcript_11511/g.26560 Transcript_11511/m.26560 type:complete len:247 (+) Transcript_11511:436-1176(+)
MGVTFEGDLESERRGHDDEIEGVEEVAEEEARRHGRHQHEHLREEDGEDRHADRVEHVVRHVNRRPLVLVAARRGVALCSGRLAQRVRLSEPPVARRRSGAGVGAAAHRVALHEAAGGELEVDDDLCHDDGDVGDEQHHQDDLHGMAVEEAHHPRLPRLRAVAFRHHLFLLLDREKERLKRLPKLLCLLRCLHRLRRRDRMQALSDIDRHLQQVGPRGAVGPRTSHRVIVSASCVAFRPVQLSSLK